MKFVLWFLLVTLFPIGLLSQGKPEEGDQQMTTPRALIESGAITRVLIFHIPDSTMTRVAVTPEALLSMSGSGFEITTDIKERLRPVLSGVSFQSEERIPDLRWGILFYDVNNREIGSVFVDKFGERGYVNRVAGYFHNDNADFNLAAELHKLTNDPR